MPRQGRGQKRGFELEPTLISVQALVHATEDKEKVMVAIKNLFPPELRDSLQFDRKGLRGYFHNPILLIVAKIRRVQLVNQTLQYLGSLLSEQEKEQLRRRMHLHYDGRGSLYMRFDKQDSFKGRLRLVERGDSLRMVVKFSGGKLDGEAVLKVCQRLGLL